MGKLGGSNLCLLKTENITEVFLSAYSWVFPADSDGLVKAEDYAKFSVDILAVKEGKAVDFTASVELTGITNVVVSGNAVVGSSNSIMLGDFASVKVVVVAGGLTFRKTISLAKSKQGGAGTSVSIDSKSVTYAASTSGTETPSAFSSTIPTVNEGEYLWTKTYVHYTDGNSTESYSVAYVGSDGVSVSDITKTESTADSGKNTITITLSDGTEQTFTVTNGSKGDTGAQGYSIVASVTRNSFTDSQWATYGTIGHAEEWSSTSSTRNNCRIGDLFTIVGTSTDGGKAYTLTYKSTTASGNLKGTCISCVYSAKGDTGKTGAYTLYQYYASNSDTTQTGGTWSDTMPSIAGTGKYLWMRCKTVPAGGSADSVSWGNPVVAGTDISKLMATINSVDGKTQTNATAVTANAEAIATKVSTDTFNGLSERVGKAESSIEANTTAISSKVSQTTYNQGVADLNTAIGKKADSSTVTTVTSRVAIVEQTAEGLTSRVEKTETGIDGAEANISTLFTQTASKISLSTDGSKLVVGEKTILLDAPNIIASGSVTANEIAAQTITADKINVDSLMASDLTIKDGGAIHSSSYKSDGTTTGGAGFYFGTDGILRSTSGIFNNLTIIGGEIQGENNPLHTKQASVIGYSYRVAIDVDDEGYSFRSLQKETSAGVWEDCTENFTSYISNFMSLGRKVNGATGGIPEDTQWMMTFTYGSSVIFQSVDGQWVTGVTADRASFRGADADTIAAIKAHQNDFFTFDTPSAKKGVYVDDLYPKTDDSGNYVGGGNLGDPRQPFKAIYAENFFPVGAIYMSTEPTSPASLFGGAWEALEEGHTLWTTAWIAGQTTASLKDEKVIDAGLPNIKGTFCDVGWVQSSEDTAPFSKVETNNAKIHGDAGYYRMYKHTFDASTASSIYSDSITTVQPPAIKIYAWRRTK